jgi:hypothetical protein
MRAYPSINARPHITYTSSDDRTPFPDRKADLPRIHRIAAVACAAAASVLIALAPDEAAAQEGRTIEQVILGRLIDDATRAPVANGTIRLLRADSSVVVSVVSDTAGRFRIATRNVGVHRLQAEHVGYRTAVSPPLQLALRDTLRLDFHVLVNATLLSPIIVRAERTLAPYYAARGMDDFYRRMMTMERALSGQFMTRDDLEKWENSTTTHMLMEFRGVDVRSARDIRMRNCAPRIYADGVEHQLLPGETLEQAFPPHMLEAVEVYVGNSVPGEFFGRSCGVIVFWRRR